MFRTLYASRINKEYPRPQKNNPCNPCNPCSKPSTHHALTRNIHVLRKAIRVIRAIRGQKPHAPRYDIVLRVPG